MNQSVFGVSGREISGRVDPTGFSFRNGSFVFVLWALDDGFIDAINQ